MNRVGVLALQGDVVEHLHALRRVGVEAVEVKNERELASVDALIVPGGESTTIAYLLTTSGIRPMLEKKSEPAMTKEAHDARARAMGFPMRATPVKCASG